MEFWTELIDFLLHLDRHLLALIDQVDVWIYPILFLVIFVETGLVIMPFLPGDSLLFTVGALAALGFLRFWPLMGLLILAAIAGDTLNYWIGSKWGAWAFSGRVRWLKTHHLQKTEEFFAAHGSKAIVIARFVPILRTFAPFVAGVGSMAYPVFLFYNVVGAVTWVLFFGLCGYWFGNLPIVEENFHLVIPAIIVLSLLPLLFEYWQEQRHKKKARIFTN